MLPYHTLMMLHRAERRYEVGEVRDEEHGKQRRLRSIVNKLTPRNFETLLDQVKQVNIDNADTLSGVIGQIFDTASMEPLFVEVYASFCSRLAVELPCFGDGNEKITFKRLLLSKCQKEFEKGDREEANKTEEEEEGDNKQTDEEREEKRRRRMLGNIRLIGELYKKRMLTERIMHECIKKLLLRFDQKSPNPDEENIEALCTLMSTVGEMIDHPKAEEHMDVYFDKMFQLSNNMTLCSRVRFMLKDAIDLRRNQWHQRSKVEGPKMIKELHRDAAQERWAQSSRIRRGGASRWKVKGLKKIEDVHRDAAQEHWVQSSRLRRGGQPMDFRSNGSTGLQEMHKVERKYEVGKIRDREEAKQRRLKSILNKLTPHNFETLFDQVKQVNIDNVDTLFSVIGQIFDTVLMEPTFVEVYANFCSRLAVELPGFGDGNEKITFKKLLLNKCQEEFERGDREEEEAANRTEEESEIKETYEEREEKRRRRMLGTIRLIGELYKKRMLTERIMHECIKKLLGFNQKNPNEKNIEALCNLMSIIGEMIDHPKAEEYMDVYFDMMFKLSNNMTLSSRVRFMLKDVIDLRRNKWQQRKVEGPKNIEEVH
ncbi:hypothetical protein QVD17_20432 [Tagetes erecta]|uniref:MIF4G domain-containing protein n=1 Tax=Tagetes erecta TaxID=13708 RepID=A0AAD8NX92_TARER|nr:hypothetical protein QVD17_20432 [Tagetes erecta]